MKQIKKLVTLLTALVLCLVPLFGNTMPVNAAEPGTIYVKYVEGMNEWRFQTGGWNPADTVGLGLPVLSEYIKDGDILVVDGCGVAHGPLNQKLSVSLSNLTYTATTSPVIITANSVENFYSVNNAQGVVNGTVKNAYVYDYSLTQFNNDVEYLEIISSKGELLHATIGSNGNVNHIKAYSPSYNHYELYGFGKGSLSVVDGTVKTASELYSKTPVATTPSAPVTTPAPATPSTPAAPSGEYDDVPKTADMRFNPLWLMALAAACFAGSYALKKED